MIPDRRKVLRPPCRWHWVVLASIGVSGLAPLFGQAGPPLTQATLGPPQTAVEATGPGIVPVQATEPAPGGVTLDAAVIWGLQNNPDLAALRQQHGVAATGVVIARTYPYNPQFQAKVFGVKGPADAGIVTNTASQFGLSLQLELFRQGKYRRETARATLTRTDWEIAYQETLLGIRVVRAFGTVAYRRDKLALLEEFAQLNQQSAEQVRRLVEQGKLFPADLILARTEVDDAGAQVANAKTALVESQAELQRSLGNSGNLLDVEGRLEHQVFVGDANQLLDIAKARRADLKARETAITEAQARLRLTKADRYGNPTFGPYYELDQDRINFIGFQATAWVPVLNTSRGLILQREAELTRTLLDLHAKEVEIRQDVETALARLATASAAVKTYDTQIIPNLKNGLDSVTRLFQQGDKVDVLRIIDLRRKLLRARDAYLDAFWEAGQAQADIAAAVGDLGLVVSSGTELPMACYPSIASQR